MTRIVAALAALLSFVMASPAQAYWHYGHQTIARIARANVTPQTRGRIDALLRQSRLLDEALG